MLMDEIPKNPNFEPFAFKLHWPILTTIRPKSQISNIGRDGVLSIGNLPQKILRFPYYIFEKLFAAKLLANN
jgi:hypothetical protein